MSGPSADVGLACIGTVQVDTITMAIVMMATDMRMVYCFKVPQLQIGRDNAGAVVHR